MRSKLLTAAILAILAGMVIASAAQAEKLICISKEKLRGEETVENCLAKGERFAVIDEYGTIRILSQEEIALMRKTNPKIFQVPAFGILYEKEAPPMPKLPHHAIPKKYQ
jgi:hypothetical protein